MSFPERIAEQRPHCGHCLVPLMPIGGQRPLWRCPDCHVVAIVYLPRSSDAAPES